MINNFEKQFPSLKGKEQFKNFNENNFALDTFWKKDIEENCLDKKIISDAIEKVIKDGKETYTFAHADIILNALKNELFRRKIKRW